METMKAAEIYHAIREMERRDYSESEIINGVEMLLRDKSLVII